MGAIGSHRVAPLPWGAIRLSERLSAPLWPWKRITRRSAHGDG